MRYPAPGTKLSFVIKLSTFKMQYTFQIRSLLHSYNINSSVLNDPKVAQMMSMSLNMYLAVEYFKVDKLRHPNDDFYYILLKVLQKAGLDITDDNTVSYFYNETIEILQDIISSEMDRLGASELVGCKYSLWDLVYINSDTLIIKYIGDYRLFSYKRMVNSGVIDEREEHNRWSNAH